MLAINFIKAALSKHYVRTQILSVVERQSPACKSSTCKITSVISCPRSQKWREYGGWWPRFGQHSGCSRSSTLNGTCHWKVPPLKGILQGGSLRATTSTRHTGRIQVKPPFQYREKPEKNALVFLVWLFLFCWGFFVSLWRVFCTPLCFAGKPGKTFPKSCSYK